MSETTATSVVIAERPKVGLKELREKVMSIQIRNGNREDYIIGGTQISACKATIKLLEAAIVSAKQNPGWLETENYCAQARDQIAEIKRIMAPLANKIRDWREEERVEAKKEETQINKGVPKTERVTVQPSIPKVAGVVRRHNWSAEVADEAKFFRAYIAADGERRAFLRKFLMIDQSAVAEFARNEKDSAKVEKLIPGVKTREWDSV